MSNSRHFLLPSLESLRRHPRVCLSEQTRTANRAVTRLYEQYLKDCDIGIAQMALLARVYYARQISVGQLATDLEIDRTTMVRTVKTLEASGHISVVTGKDKRARLIQLTEKGFQSLEMAIPRWQRAQEELRKLIGDSEWESAMHTMRSLTERIAARFEIEGH